MIRLFAVLAALASCMLLSTCGSARAIVGDFADDYIIKNITPLSGVSGEQVRFIHQVCFNDGAIAFDYIWDAESEAFEIFDFEGEPPKYFWDFGGGAEPNISYDIFPEVTLRDGLRAPYQGSLTICDGCEDGTDITATFTYEVAPLTVLTVSPLSGVAAGNATFSALIGSGSVTTYAWDFGGAGSPNGSNLENPTIVFSDNALGIYQCNLIVSNNYEAFEFPFTISVTQ